MAPGRSLIATVASSILGTVSGCGGCTRPAPGFCCLTLEDCGHFGVDEVRQCAADETCLGNECAPKPDADMADAADACVVAGGQIAFQTDRYGETEIARILADGTGYQRLTNNTWRDELPRFSPDGARIAWVSYPTGEPELFVMNADGSAAQNVSNGAIYLYGEPRWSPDGSAILFVRRVSGDNEIVRVSADGTNLIPVSQLNFCGWPDWSPNSQRIVFSTGRVYVADADGSNPNPITVSDGDHTYSSPRWSPSGQIIVAHRESGTAPYPQELWKLSPTGTDDGQVVDHDALNKSWSPDGQIVAYDYYGDIMVAMPATGSGETALTNDAAEDTLPTWSPDGGRLLFQTDRDGNSEIYTMAADGTELVNLTNDQSADTAGNWAPCPP
jgi:Tol biopolymer transport system component